MRERNILKMITRILVVTIFLCLMIVLIALLVVITDKSAYASEIRYLTEEEMRNRPVIEVEKELPIEIPEVETFDETEETAFIEDAYIYIEEIPLDEVYQRFLQCVCEEYHVGYAFALAIIESESGFDVNCGAGDGGASIGICQINRPNWYRYGLDAHNISENIEIGVRMLAELIEKYQETDAVIMAYKGGEAFADEWIAEGKRLDACDKVVDRTMYWQEVIDKK